MSSIERYISPFIAQQFPSFYRTDGKNFVAFVKAYYEWLEQSNNAIGRARSMLDLADIDLTIADFIDHFKDQYVVNLPASVLADKRLLIKHITDLYRSKGSKRAYELLFRLAFNEDIDIYVPSEFIFKPSDNTWFVPRYLEVTSNPFLQDLVGTDIKNSDGTATAIVENYSQRVINGRTVNVLEVSAISGEFKNGDKILPLAGTLYTAEDAPIIRSSLIGVAVSEGGQDYSVGDILDVSGSGIEGRVRVAAISNNFSGAVEFRLIDGGSGYTLNAVVSVARTLNINVAEMIFPYVVGESVVETTTNANGTVVFANSTFVQLVDFSPSVQFVVGDTLLGAATNSVITRVTGGAGSGASFRVGSIINKESITFIADTMDPYLTIQLDSSGSNSYSLGVNSVSGTFSVGQTVTSSANTVVLEVVPTTNTFIQTNESLSNSSLGISGLYAYRPDQSLIWCTGTDADLTNANLVSGVILIGNTSGGQVQLLNAPTKETYVGNAVIEFANSSQIRLSSVNGYFVATATLTNSNTGGTATITSVTRLTDWGFANSSAQFDNLDSVILQVVPESTLEIGTIASLTAIAPGAGYLTRPYITVKEPSIISLNLFDIDGSQKGNNAFVDSNIIAGNGTISAVEIIDSGFGYLNNESVVLSRAGNQTTALGSAIVFGSGKGSGRWLNRKSFVSDVTRLQDGLFYQNYSYEIVAERMLESYDALVRNLVHPAGIALYGRYRSIDFVVDNGNSVEESSIQQQ